MGLTELLPAKARKVLYVVFAIIALALGATQVGYSTAGTGQPGWLTVTLAVFAFLGTALGITAAANTPTKNGKVEPYDPEAGRMAAGRVVGIAAAAVLLVGLGAGIAAAVDPPEDDPAFNCAFHGNRICSFRLDTTPNTEGGVKTYLADFSDHTFEWRGW